MRFGWKKQRFLEASRKVGFERRDPPRIDVFISAGAAGKLGKLGSIPCGRGNQRSSTRRDGHGSGPEFEGFEAEIENEFFRVLGLAPGRQHAAREIGTAKARTFAAFDEFDIATRAGELERDGQACDAGANDSNAHGSTLLHLAAAKQKRREWTIF
jgi:hypothetical protein